MGHAQSSDVYIYIYVCVCVCVRIRARAFVCVCVHSLKLAAGGIGLHVNADKMDYMRFYLKGDISTLHSGSLKLVNKFTYLGSSL